MKKIYLSGNFVAIASMEPTIDIWDLDVVDNLEPLATLGQRPKKKKVNSKHNFCCFVSDKP